MGEFIAHPVVKVESAVNQKVKLKCACMTKKTICLTNSQVKKVNFSLKIESFMK